MFEGGSKAYGLSLKGSIRRGWDVSYGCKTKLSFDD